MSLKTLYHDNPNASIANLIRPSRGPRSEVKPLTYVSCFAREKRTTGRYSVLGASEKNIPDDICDGGKISGAPACLDQ